MQTQNIIATIHTNLGDIKLELDAKNAPITTENFVTYAKEGFYNDTIFHRVIDGFMIQGGGLLTGLKDKKSTKDPIRNEGNNGLSNTTGTIAMARTNDPHSATTQFFINVKDNNFLDFKSEDLHGWGYAVFGKVIDGLDVVNKIKTVKTKTVSYHENVPIEDITIYSIAIDE